MSANLFQWPRHSSRHFRIATIANMAGESSIAPASEPVRTQEAHRLAGIPARIHEHSDLVAAVIVAIGFIWRLWRAQATFFNTDEAWHFSLANQNSLAAAYKASLTISHPPLLIFVLYFWRHIGTSNLVLRLPPVIAGTLFCWAVYKWISRVFGQTAGWLGLLFATFLPPLISLSADLRQYTLMMLFAVCSAYLLEEALARNSVGHMIGSSLCLYLAMSSHYSAFLFAAALGAYCIVRMIRESPRRSVITTWVSAQVVGVGLAYFFFVTQISKLGRVYSGAQPLHNYADWYLSDWYFHPGRDHLLPFLYRGTFGIFRFTFGQTGVGQIATILFFVGVLLISLRRPTSRRLPPRSTAVLLLVPFVLNWAAVSAGLYPYGRTRQCIYLAIFAIAGVSAALSILSAGRAAVAAVLAVAMIIVCQARGTLQGRDMLPLADQRHEHMDEAIQFIRSQVSPSDAVFTDQATSFQLRHYLCDQKPVDIEDLGDGLSRFRCERLTVYFTGPDDGALTAEGLSKRWHNATGRYDLYELGVHVWVVQGGWATGLGEALRPLPRFGQIEIHSFGHYLEVFQLPRPRPVALER